MITKIQKLIPKLIFSVLITSVIASAFSLSRFQITKTGESDVTVASFVINATGSDIDKLSLDCSGDNSTIGYDVIVTNKQGNFISDVSIKYDIVVEFSEELPEGIIISDGTIILDAVEAKTTYIFNDIGIFNAKVEKSNKHTITLMGSNEILSAYNGDMSIYIDAIQID